MMTRLALIFSMLFTGCTVVRPTSPAADAGSLKSVDCTCVLTAYEAEHSWSEYFEGEGCSDGVAPLVSFRIVEPEAYADRRVGILFKYERDSDQQILTSMKESRGQMYTVALPRDFLEGDYRTIDTIELGRVEKISL